MQNMIKQIHIEKGNVSILDVGGLEQYWGIFPADFLTTHRVRIVLLNLPSADEFAVTLPETFVMKEGDACDLPYSDNSFDICHSNSVIEHVGPWKRKEAFAREVRRVAPRYFHQTPNFWFPWEPHYELPFFHWLPEPTRLWITTHHKVGTWPQAASNAAEGMAIVEDASLINASMMRYLFPDAQLFRERFLGMTKSFVAIRN